jgi:hypothetical protein
VLEWLQEHLELEQVQALVRGLEPAQARVQKPELELVQAP